MGQAYQAQSKSLNLEGLATQLQDIPAASFKNSLFIQELLKIIEQNCREVQTVNFSNNGITTLSHFRGLHRAAPQLVNLCFAKNNISRINELESIRDLKLHELILIENPITSSTHELIYHHEVQKRFPGIKLLDTEPLKQVIQFDIKTNPMPPVQGSFFDSEHSLRTATTFVNKFFQLYDSDRQQLLSAYAANASFSLCVSSKANSNNLPQPYISASRNLLKLNNSKDRLVTTPLSIIYQLTRLPPTQHNIPEFVADVFVLPSQTTSAGGSVLTISLRGTFTENGNVLRLFHRTFLLVPPQDDQWPALIVNDQVHISELDQKLVGIMAQPVAAPSGPPAVSSNSPGLNAINSSPAQMPSDQQLVQRLCAQTGCAPDIATQALTHTKGNYDAALQAIAAHQGGS